MKKTIFVSIFALFVLFGCADQKEKIKDTSIKTDDNKSISVSKIFEEYQYFKSVKWDGEERVSVECEIDLNKEPIPEFRDNYKSITATFVFDPQSQKAILLKGKYIKQNGETKSKDMPQSPAWMVPEQIIKDTIYPKKPFSDITALIAYQ